MTYSCNDVFFSHRHKYYAEKFRFESIEMICIVGVQSIEMICIHVCWCAVYWNDLYSWCAVYWNDLYIGVQSIEMISFIFSFDCLVLLLVTVYIFKYMLYTCMLVCSLWETWYKGPNTKENYFCVNQTFVTVILTPVTSPVTKLIKGHVN
jgi:hypothetical protein